MCCGRKPSKRRRPKFKHLKSKATVEALSSQPKIKKLLMCRPDHYGIQYQINPWMSINNPVDRQKAIEQWDTLRDRLAEHGAELHYIKSQPNLPDMVFTANAGLILKDRTFIASNFKYIERKDEEQFFVTWFGENDYRLGYPSVPFEGAGDALFLGETLICGQGHRSVSESYEEISVYLSTPRILAHLIDDRFYHLDTCFCPLNGMDYLIYPHAFEAECLNAMRELGGNELVVSEDEALNFACNAVCLGDKVIMPNNCPETMELLKENGYTAVPVDMSEFKKSGGGPKCLSLEIL